MQVPDSIPDEGRKEERSGGMTSDRRTVFSLTENGWRTLLLGTSLVILAFTVWCLSQGITTIFMHLYYFPIILLAYHYHKKGVVLSAVLGFLYVALVTIFTFPNVEDISGALLRFVVFVMIAAVVSFLAESLKNRELERNTIIENSEDGIFVADLSLKVITEVNRRGAEMLGYEAGELVNQPLATIWQERQELIRCLDFIRSSGFARNIEVHLIQKSGGTRAVLLSAGALPDQRIVLTATDITDRELMLTDMRRLSDVRESIIKNANVWLMVVDSHGKILEWNKAAEVMSGYPAKEVAGENEIWKHLYPKKEYRREITKKITGIISRDNYLENLLTTIITKTGSEKTILWNTRGLPDKKGIVERYIAIGVDITDREKAGQVSREYAEWYSTLLRTTQDGYVLTDASSRILEVNDNYCRMTGFSREELLKKTISEMDVDESKENVSAHIQKILKTGSDRFETRHRTKDAGTIDVEVSVALQVQKRMFIVFVRNITERRNTEKALTASEAKYRSLIENINDVIYSLDEKGTITYLSPAIEKITGYSPSQMMGHPFTGFSLKGDLPGMVQTFEEARKGNIVSIQFRSITKSGELRWIHSSGYPAFTNGVFSGVQGILSDITERKLAEEALRESEGRLKAILDSIIAGVVIIDPATHTISDINSVAARMIGAKKEDIIGSVCHRYICPAEIGACPITDLNQMVNNSEKVLLTQSGEKIPILKSVVPITINFRPHLLESFIDISDLKRAESALLESEEKYRAFFTTSRDCVFITSLDGRWADLNDAAVELFGYDSREELLQVTIRDLYANPEERARHVDIIRQKGFTRNFPVDLRKKDGTVIHTLISSVIRKDKDGTLVGFQGTIRDITELKQVEEALHNSQQILRTVLDTIPVRVFWKDVDLHYLGCNVPFAQDAGFHEPEELIGKDDYQMGWRDQAELYRTDDRQVIETGKPKILIEEPQTTPDGKIIWLLTSKTPLHDESGRVSGVLGAYIDITERKQVEKALMESEIKLAESMDLAHLVNWEFDVPTGIFTFNDRFYALYGTTAEREGGYQMPAEIYAQKFVHPEDMPMVSVEISKAIANTDPDYVSRIEHRIIRKDGEVRIILVTIGIIKDAEGRTVKTHGANQDITERKQIEEALVLSEQRYRILAESAQDVIIIIDRDLKLTYVNSFGALQIGKTPKELIGIPLQKLFPPQTFEKMSSAIHEAFETKQSQHFEIEVPLPLSHQWHDAHLVPLVDKNGNIFSVLGISRDITELKDNEVALKKAHDELELRVRQRTAELAQVNVELEGEITERKAAEERIIQSLHEKEILLREVHHRVRNNFQIIISLLSLQSRSIGDEKVTQAMKESQNRIQAMSFVHENLYTSKDLSRIDLEPYVTYMTSQLFNLFNVHTGAITLILDVKNIFVDINTAIPFGLVINELVTNSLKHAFPNGRKGVISISIHDNESGLTLSYEDNGIGFLESFDWQTTDNLGFRLIRGLIDQLSGTIEQESCEGTCFTIRIKKKTGEVGGLHGTFNPVPE